MADTVQRVRTFLTLVFLCSLALSQQPVAATIAEGQQHFQRGNYEAAAVAYTAAYSAAPTPELAYWVGVCAIQLYKIKDAENWLQIAIAAPQAKGAWFQAYAKCLLDNGKPLAAREALTRALTIGPRTDPNYGVWFYNRGLCSLEAAEYSPAIADFEACVAHSPKHAQAWYSLGLARTDVSDSKGALTALQMATALEPSNIEALFLLGRTQLGEGAVEAAIVTMRQVLGKVSGHVGALWNLSRALQRLGRKEEAKAEFTRFKALAALNERIEYTETAVKINQNNAALRIELVKLLLEAGRARDAMTHLDTLRRTAPGSTVFFQMSKALRLLGAREEADRAEEAARQLLQQGR